MLWRSEFVSATLNPDVDAWCHFRRVQLSMAMSRMGWEWGGPMGNALVTQTWGFECDSPESMQATYSASIIQLPQSTKWKERQETLSGTG